MTAFIESFAAMFPYVLAGVLSVSLVVTVLNYITRERAR